MAKLKKKKLYKIEGLSRRRLPYASSLDAPKQQLRSGEDPAVVDILYRIGETPENYKVAQRAANLQRQHATMSLPEALGYDFLQTNQVEFDYQPWVMGGRARGGLVPDFLIRTNTGGMVWLIQGSYYHSPGFQQRHGQRDRDIRAELVLKGSVVNGVRVDTVIPLWEDDIYDRREDVFRNALSGFSQ